MSMDKTTQTAASELLKIANMVLAKPVTAGYTADDLFDSVMKDMWPGMGAMVDFGLDGFGAAGRADAQKRYEALYYPIRAEEITMQQLRQVVGDGAAITKLVNRCPSNPHKGIKFITVYDGM